MSNEKQQADFGRTSGFIVLFMGILLTPIGISGLVGTPWSGISWVLLLLTLAGMLLIAGSVNMLRTANKQAKTQAALEKTLQIAKSTNTTPDMINGVPIHAHWDIDENTWNKFKQNEIKYRNDDNIYFFIAFVIIGTIGIIWNSGASITISLIIAIIMGIILVLIRRGLALSKLHTGIHKKEVYISDYFVILNGEQYVLFSPNRQTSKVKLIETEEPVILEYTIHWPTRNGTTFDELRIPVPPNAIDSARTICNNFKPIVPAI